MALLERHSKEQATNSGGFFHKNAVDTPISLGDLVPGFPAALQEHAGDSFSACVQLTVETFKSEIAAALKSYDRHVVCLEKIPEDCEASLSSLLEKAIKAYLTRGPEMRHGIALDRHITIILSQTTDQEIPLCGIYFNLHSPYSKRMSSKPEKASP